MLILEDIHTYYGESHILRGVSMQIDEGETVTLLGRNGAGKTTLVKSVMGIVPPRSGRILYRDIDITGWPSNKIAKLGIGYVPEERRIFPSLTVMENLMLPMWGRGLTGWTLDKIHAFFPILKTRARHSGSQLSGGEQQMLALARILRADMDLILLDEPSEGLAPLLVRTIGDILKEIKKSGLTILLIEQNTRFTLQVADTHHILYGGNVVYRQSNEAFRNDTATQKRYLGI